MGIIAKGSDIGERWIVGDSHVDCGDAAVLVKVAILKASERLEQHYYSLKPDLKLTGQLGQLGQQMKCHKGRGKTQDTPGDASLKILVATK
jgi:hypothetical protein